MNSIIRFSEDVCGDVERTKRLEWLETNGLGGFASSSITGMNTRRYHGLLTAATKPPVGRVLLLSKLEETLVIDGERYDLSANQYPGVIHPQGYRHLAEFRLDPFPVFTYRIGDIQLEKRVFMVHGENTTVIEYRLSKTNATCTLELRPLIAFRDYHSTTRDNAALHRAFTQELGCVSIAPYPDLPSLHFVHNATDLNASGDWYHNFEYVLEQERGLDYREDLFNPFVLNFDLTQTMGAATVIASIDKYAGRTAEAGGALGKAEVARRQELRSTAPCDDPLVRSLAVAADQFIVKRGELKTIIAGYPWFADWGRDTMIALPGLTLTTGRYDIAKNILLAFAENVDEGMLPNRFPDAGEIPEYNTVDATLWFFEAVRAYLSYTPDAAFVRKQIYPKLKEIIDWHVRGTRYGIKMDPDGLLRCGEAGVQLTWMDAKIGDWVVTPREGKPVEIQALWYNALCVMETLARSMDPDSAGYYRGLATNAKESFEPLFWNESTLGLFDVVNEHRDAAIRPNQIFAVSLPHSMLSEERARQVVETVKRELLTPLGLRTLAPGDPNYRPHYQGGVWERDSAYHQGTVWPWLLGPFITAFLKVEKHSPAARKEAEQWLRGFSEHLSQAGLGQVSEIADAAAPHNPRGCIAQAWSVAELLRAAAEDVFSR